VERPKPGAVIRGLRDAGKLLSNLGSVKTTREEAQAEMSAGLKKKRKSDTDTEPPQPGKKMKGKEREKLCFSPLFFSCLKHNPEDNKPSKPKPETTEGEDFAFGKWVLLPCGLRVLAFLFNSEVRTQLNVSFLGWRTAKDEITSHTRDGGHAEGRVGALSTPAKPLSINTA
jgi:hypothetical protein